MSNFKQAISELVNDLDDAKESLKDQQYKKIIEQVGKVNSSRIVDTTGMTEEEKNLLLVSINPDLLTTIQNPSEQVIKEAIKRKPELIKNVSNPSPSTVVEAYKRDKNILSLIGWFTTDILNELEHNGAVLAFGRHDKKHKWILYQHTPTGWQEVELR